MKLEKFLWEIENKLLNYPDINLTTVKLFMDIFDSCLSMKELEREKVKQKLEVIERLTTKQITIDTIIENEKVKHLNKELQRLKKK